MNVKKFLSVALAVVMILLACPLSIFAADGDLRLETYDANGEVATSNDYTTFAAAFAALDTIYDNVDAAYKTSDEALYAAAGKPVIKLTGDFTAASTTINNWNNTTDLDNNAVRTIVIDGDNGEDGKYKITYSTTKDKIFAYLGTTNLHVKNVEFDMTFTSGDGAFDWGGAGVAEQVETDTVFENCVIDYKYSGGNNDGCLFKMNGKRKANYLDGGTFYEGDTVAGDIFNLTLNGCTITQTGALGVQIHWGADANINIQNTTWTRTGGTNAANHGFVKGYDCGDITVNVDGNSTLESRISAGTTGGTFFYVTSTSAYGMTVTLEQGATLYMNDSIDGTNTSLVDADSTSLKIIDKGATWKIGATTATYGIKTESVMGGNGKMIGFKNGDTDVTGIYTATEAPASDLVLTTYELDHAAQDYAVYVTNEAGTVKGYYKTLESTYSILGNHDVIHLMKDITKTSADVRPTSSNGYTVTIDGTKATDGAGNVTERYKLTQTSAYTFEVGNINFIMSNVILQATKGLRYHAFKRTANSTEQADNFTYSTTVENVDMTLTAGIAIKIGGGDATLGTRTYNVTINDSKINHNYADTVFYGAGNLAKYSLTIHNTEVTRTKGTGSGNGFIFNLFNTLGGTVNLTGTTKMNVKNDATNWGGVFYTHPGSVTNPVEITVGAGVEMNLLSSTTTSTDTEFYYSGKLGSMTVHDLGAVYTVSKEVAALGVYIPAVELTSYVKDNVTYDNVTFNRYYNDEMVPSSSWYGGASKTADNDGTLTTFAVPGATGNVTFENRFIVPEIYNNDATVAMIRKDAEGNVTGTYTATEIETAITEVASGETLVLLRDIVTTSEYQGSGAKSYTIDGQGKYGIIQNNQIGNYLLYAPHDGNTLTIKDATMNVQGGFWYEKATAQTVVLDNVLMTNGSARAFMALRTNAGDHQLYLTNGTVVTAYECNGSVISASTAGGKLVVDNSVLRIAENVPVVNTPANCSVSFVNGGSLAYTANVLASAGDTGVTLPGVVDENGDTIATWVVNGATYTGTTYANASATADVVLTPLTSLFTTLDGASVRVDAPAGIRFEAWFDDALLALDGIEVGVLVTGNSDTLTSDTFVLSGNETDGYTVNGQAVINQAGGPYKEDGTDNLLRVVLANISEEYYDVEFAARAYIKLNGVTYYAGFDSENVRSLKGVAIAALELPEYENNTFLQSIANS